jgi:hypothetical protein
VFKTFFVAFISGGLSYGCFYFFSRVLKNVFTDKSQLL